MLDKLYAFAGGKSEQVKALEKEKDQIAREIEMESAEIARLVKSKGWKLIEKFLDNKKQIAFTKMKTCKQSELNRLQADIVAIEGLFGTLNAKIIAYKNNK